MAEAIIAALIGSVPPTVAAVIVHRRVRTLAQMLSDAEQRGREQERARDDTHDHGHRDGR